MTASVVTMPAKRPSQFLVLTFSWLLLFSVGSASTLDGVCDGIKQLGGCKAVIRIPTLALTYCEIPSIKIDKCKTKLKGRYPCGISIRGVKMCDGWTCVPGTVPTTIRGPCGVKVGSKPLDLCGVARKAVPKMDELVKQAGGICSCLPKILDFVDLDTVKSAVTSLDASDVMADILNKYGDAQVCLIDNGFNVQDNRKGLLQNTGALVTTKDVKIFTAAEIDLSRYIALAGALAPCFFVPPACNEPAIRGFFTDYLTDSEKLLGEQITEFLTPWQKSFDDIATNYNDIGKSLGQIAGQFGTIKTSITNITDDFCKNMTVCAETTVGKLQTQALNTIQHSQAFTGLTSDITKAIDETQQVYKVISDAIVSFEALTDLGIDNIIPKVLNGEIRGIKEIAATLQSVQKLPKIIGDIQKSIPSIEGHLKTLQNGAPDFLNNIESILQSSWLADAQADAASAAAAESAVQRIQALFNDNVVPHATAVSDGITSIVKSFELVLVAGPPSIDLPSVASYQRWSKGHFAMPCLTTGKITLRLGTYTKVVDYPKFYRCEQDYRIPFPNHHIPFIKVTFGSASKRSTRFVHGARQEVVVEPLTEPNPIEQPTMSTASWPSISEAPDSEGTVVATALDEYDPTATEIVVPEAATSFSIPADVYTDTANVPEPTALPSGLVFFASTDANGAAVEFSTTLAANETFEVTATEVITSAIASDAPPITTPVGFEEGTITAATTRDKATTTAVSGTGTGTGSAASATSTFQSTAGDSFKIALIALLAPMGAAFLLL